MLASVTSNSSVSSALLPAAEGLASLTPPAVLQLSGAGATEGPVGLVSARGQGESFTELHLGQSVILQTVVSPG